jgi:anaphase-promoting complex subunit 3
MALDRLAPQSWLVLGNCFSLQKEHETAQKFFQRALSLDPNLAYAHTLCGHEYFANEDFDKSLACFRNAIRIDSRHYNAWCVTLAPSTT